MMNTRILSVVCALSMSGSAFAQEAAAIDGRDDEINCNLPENAELEECLVLLPAGDVTNLVAIGAGGVGLLTLFAAGSGGGTSGTTGTTGTTN